LLARTNKVPEIRSSISSKIALLTRDRARDGGLKVGPIESDAEADGEAVVIVGLCRQD
jgi:hypothetical protein